MKSTKKVVRGFEQAPRLSDSYVRCVDCGETCTVEVEHGQHADEHECYSQQYDETAGTPVGGI